MAERIFKETWETKELTPVSFVTYVQRVQERLKQVQQLAGVFETKAKTNTKVWYERNARQRTFEVGEQVLLPAQKNKLLAEWQSPYTFHKRITDVNMRLLYQRNERRTASSM